MSDCRIENEIIYVIFSVFQKPNLILNVDGLIGVAFVDLLRNCGCFTAYVQIDIVIN